MGAARPAPGRPLPPYLLAPNPSPLTLDGTRTYIVGRRRVAILDPGPLVQSHLDAVAEAVADAESVAILVTHDHPDHAPGARPLADRLGTPVRSASSGTLREGDVVETDAGVLRALATPGHAPDHVAFEWPEGRAIFCGDLMLGGQDSTLVAPPEGDLTDYIASLERLRVVRAAVLYPTHGEPFTDPDAAIERYLRHREERLAQVLGALAAGAATPDIILERVYGGALDPRLAAAASGATLAYLAHLEGQGRARRLGGGRWAAA